MIEPRATQAAGAKNNGIVDPALAPMAHGSTHRPIPWNKSSSGAHKTVTAEPMGQCGATGHRVHPAPAAILEAAPGIERVFVLWDEENVSARSGLDVRVVVEELEQAARALTAGPGVSFRLRVFADVGRLSRQFRTTVTRMGVSIIDNGVRKAEQADKHMERNMVEIADDFGTGSAAPRTALVLVTTDMDFGPVLKRVRESGVRVGLIVPDVSPAVDPQAPYCAVGPIQGPGSEAVHAFARRRPGSSGPGPGTAAVSASIWSLARHVDAVAMSAAVASGTMAPRRVFPAAGAPAAPRTPDRAGAAAATPPRATPPSAPAAATTGAVAAATPGRGTRGRAAAPAAAQASPAAPEATAPATPAGAALTPGDPQEAGETGGASDPPQRTPGGAAPPMRMCRACGVAKPAAAFSGRQWQGHASGGVAARRCRACIRAGQTVPARAARGRGRGR